MTYIHDMLHRFDSMANNQHHTAYHIDVKSKNLFRPKESDQSASILMSIDADGESTKIPFIRIAFSEMQEDGVSKINVYLQLSSICASGFDNAKNLMDLFYQQKAMELRYGKHDRDKLKGKTEKKEGESIFEPIIVKTIIFNSIGMLAMTLDKNHINFAFQCAMDDVIV